MDKFICIECEFHKIDKNARVLCCKKFNSAVSLIHWCANSISTNSLDLSDELKKIINNPDEKVLGELIKAERYREAQEYASMIREKKQRAKERHDAAERRAVARLRGLNIIEETCSNFKILKCYVVKTILNEEDADDLTIELLCDWNYSGLKKLKQEKMLEEKVKESDITSTELLKYLKCSHDGTISYVYDYGFDGENNYYSGLGIVEVRIERIGASRYVVLTYDKREDNNGRGGDSLRPEQIHKIIMQDYREGQSIPVVMRENQTKNIELIKGIIWYPILKDIFLIKK